MKKGISLGSMLCVSFCLFVFVDFYFNDHEFLSRIAREITEFGERFGVDLVDRIMEELKFE